MWSSEGQHYSGAVSPIAAYWRWDVLGGADGFGAAGHMVGVTIQEEILNSLL